MKRILLSFWLLALAASTRVPAQVNPYKDGIPGVTGYRSEVLAGVMIQEDKFTRLAEAIPGGSENRRCPVATSKARSGPRWPAGRTTSRPEPGASVLVVPHETGGQPPQSQASALGTAASEARARVRARRRIGSRKCSARRRLRGGKRCRAAARLLSGPCPARTRRGPSPPAARPTGTR